GQPLRVVKLRLGEWAIGFARRAGAGDGDLPAIEIRNDDAVVCAVGDEQAFGAGVGKHLSGKEQGPVPLFLSAGQLEAERLLLQDLFFAVLLDEQADVVVEQLEIALAPSLPAI